MTIYYTINHFVTADGTDTDTDTTDAMSDTTLHGDDAVAVWLVSDYTSDAPDLTIEQPDTGFTWRVDMDGWTDHSPELDPEDHVDTIKTFTTDAELQRLTEDYLAGDIKRVDVWDTPLTDGYTQS